MNSNFWRTILNVITGGTFASLANALLGCTGDNPLTPTIVEPAVCTGGAIPIPLEWQALAGLVFVGLGFLMKGWGGTGSVAQNLAMPIAPIVPPAEAKPGVVTPAQVASTGPNK